MSTPGYTFDYEIPRRLIAQEPLPNRVDARLMLVDRQTNHIEHHHVRDLPQLLEAGDRLVLNNTRVIPATLQGKRTATDGHWKGLFLNSLAEGHWRIICKSRGRLKPGESITLLDREMRPTCKLWLLEKLNDGSWIAHPDSQSTHADLLQQVGRVPLPHYIRGGHMVDADAENYQTVFARRPGAVAAPTAGLHFTKRLLETIEQQGTHISAVTLHVGLGTFRPIQSEVLEDHVMHSEVCEVSPAAAGEINATRSAGGRIVAVGTTVVRVLETVAQRAWRDNQNNGAPGTYLTTWSGETELFIRPPFEFRAVDALLTNFHFPRTTLLVLVQTFGGRELIEKAYQEAIREEYRFFSYGDAMLIV